MTEVRIFRPSKKTTQSGRGHTDQWVVEYAPSGNRRPDPLMGWIVSDDTRHQVRIEFDTLEQAKRFVDKKGWQAEVIEPKDRSVRPRNYSDNFRYIPPGDG
jgi:hypothetical protein